MEVLETLLTELLTTLALTSEREGGKGCLIACGVIAVVVIMVLLFVLYNGE